MLSTIRTFRRHYHKVRNIYAKLAEDGDTASELEFKFEGNRLRIENKTPEDEEKVVQFTVLMYQFLNPSNPLYYNKVWSRLKKEFSEEIPETIAEEIEALIRQIKEGFVEINVNDDNFTAEQIYILLSLGEYFDADEAAQDYLRSLTATPGIGPLLWKQFYTYTLQGFTLISRIFDVILEIEQSTKYKDLYLESRPVKNYCIYCLDSTGDFTSEEHIFPESLGNDELVLPKGYVCNKCNNETLGALDQGLLEFPLISFLQTQFVQFKRTGKLPEANFQNVSIKKTRPRHMVVSAKDKTGRIKDIKDLGNGYQSFTISMRAKYVPAKLFGKALYKIALGMVAFAEGHEQACSHKYDMAREFITKEGQNFPNNLLMCMKISPRPQCRIGRFNSGGTTFAIDIYGLIFLLNLEENPTLELNEALRQLNFELFSLN